jgi:ABC-type multidrug transport system ATPase subunit
MIACNNITFRYPGAERPLFDGLDLSIDEPGFHALFGPSGVGKTTFAKMISGDIDNYSGQIIRDNDRPCLYTYNQERLPGWSSVGKHLEKAAPPDRHPLKNKLIDGFGLSELLGLRFAQLSMGQCNRVNLLRYLLQDFRILIMDESLANVDEPTRQTILYMIKSLFPDSVFLYISHNVVEVSRFCNQIYVFRSKERRPKVVRIKGQDHQKTHSLDRNALERAMLEIMNAA